MLVPLGVPLRPVPASPSFTFTAAGDYGSLLAGTNGARVVAKIRELNPDFHIALGDLRYNTMNATSWCQTFKTSFNRVLLIAGNHDDGDIDRGPMNTFVYACPFSVLGVSLISGPHQGNIDPSGKTAYGYDYSFEYPPANPLAKFIMIDPLLNYNCCGYPVPTSYPYSVGSAEYNWVSSQIDDAKTRGLWTIIGEHYNAFSNGGQEGYSTSLDLVNLLYKKRVDLFLAGHDHEYQRTVQLRDCNTRDIGSCTVVNSGTTGPYLRGAGTVYSIIGTGGEVQPRCCTQVSSPWAAGTYGTFGVVSFTITDTSITGSFEATEGSFTDEFSVKSSLTTDFAKVQSPLYMLSGFIVVALIATIGVLAIRTRKHRFRWIFQFGAQKFKKLLARSWFRITLTG